MMTSGNNLRSKRSAMLAALCIYGAGGTGGILCDATGQEHPTPEEPVVIDCNQVTDDPGRPAYALSADLDGSACVDLNDLGYLADHWLWSGPIGEQPADLAPDGVVNLLDLNTLASQWRQRPASVIIFIDCTTYALLKQEIQRLAWDIRNDLEASVYVFPNAWTDVQDIKQILRDYHTHRGHVPQRSIRHAQSSAGRPHPDPASPACRPYS